MAVKIKTANNFILSGITLDFVFDVKQLRMKNFRWVFPSSVQVHSCDIATAVSVDDSVDVYHWENNNCVIFEQILDFLFVFLLLLVFGFVAKCR
jgi:hypothetical protein